MNVNGTTRLERRDSVLYIVAEWDDVDDGVYPAGPRRLAIEVAAEVLGGITSDVLSRARRHLADMTDEFNEGPASDQAAVPPGSRSTIVIFPGESAVMINSAPATQSRKLVYGHAKVADCLAFADGATAQEEAREITAIISARTWGEARGVEPRHTWNPVPDLDDDPDGPADDAPFDIRELGAVQDGDWPPMVTGRALEVLPEDLQKQFGESMATVLNGDSLEIPLAAEAELVATLRDRGFEVTRDDELIRALNGGSLGD
jgi:hypothetical protein